MSEPTGTASLLGEDLLLADAPRPEEVAVASYHDREPIRRMMVFSGRSNPDLARVIASNLGLTLGDVELKTFPNGELYVRFGESIRGADVFLVQSCSTPVNRNLMELLLMVNAAKLASAKRITAVMPWYPYSRADKKSAPREPISARLVADLLQSSGVDRVLTMDLHAGQVQGFFNIPVDHMTALPMFAQYFRDQGLPQDRLVVVSPDAGRVKLAKKFAEMLGADLAFINKERPAHGESPCHDADRRRQGQGRDHLRRHDRQRRHAVRGRGSGRRGRRRAGAGLRDARPVLAARAREHGRIGARAGRRLRYHPRRSADEAREDRGALGGGHPGPDDRQRLPRRLGLGHLQG